MATAPRSGEAVGRGLLRAPLAILAMLSLGACASLTPYRAPTRTELDRVKRVEVKTVVGGLTVDLEQSRAAEGSSGSRPHPARLRLGPATEREIAASIVERGPRETALPFQPVGEELDKASTARLEVKLVSVTLATGAGSDPLTALWVRFRVRLAVPQWSVEDGALRRVWLGPSYPTAVDPSPLPLSEWVADDGARLRAAVAEISAREVPRFVADLRGRRSAGPGDAGGVSLAETDAPSGAPGGERDGVGMPQAREGAELQIDYVPTGSSGGATLKALGFFGGMTLGGVVGAGYGAGLCAKAVNGGREIGAILFAACAVVAVPVGALIGVPMGAAKGFELAEKHVAKDEAARRAEIARNRTVLTSADRVADLAQTIARASEAIVEAGSGDDRSVVGGVRVRLVQNPGDGKLADLEVELTLRSGEAANARARQLCLRGPGPLPTELWLRPGGELIRAAVEAHLARVVRLGEWGLEPRSGDGPCS